MEPSKIYSLMIKDCALVEKIINVNSSNRFKIFYFNLSQLGQIKINFKMLSSRERKNL